MKIIVVGLGVQGEKRSALIKKNLVASVDLVSKQATYKNIYDVPTDSFDAAFLCVPNDQKISLIDYCIRNRKHALVEKPLAIQNSNYLLSAQREANRAGVYVYTAYNHRFEPSFQSMKVTLNSGKLGKLFSIRMFYGNGTAQLVKNSKWRDQGMGVISDLMPHLLDTLQYWLEDIDLNILHVRASRFETNAPDHALILANLNGVEVQLEVSLCMWKNSFSCDIIGDRGSAHISSLCKWGPSLFITRERVIPAGKPLEEIQETVMPDPTWKYEHDYFLSQIQKGARTDFSSDIWIADTLHELSSHL